MLILSTVLLKKVVKVLVGYHLQRITYLQIKNSPITHIIIKFREIEYLDTPFKKIKLRKTSRFKQDNLLNLNVRSYEIFGKLDPKIHY